MPVTPSIELATRAMPIGCAAGARSTLGIGVPALLSPTLGRFLGVKLGAITMMSGEVVWDQLPNCPSRLEWPGLASRIISGGAGALIIARATRQPVLVAATIGALSALGAAIAGTRWRRHWSQNHHAWVSGVLEDAVALSVATLACHG